MDIRFISTLTAEDEGHMAPALMNAVTALLDALPIAYTLRIETLGAQVFQHTHPSAHAAIRQWRRRTLFGAGRRDQPRCCPEHSSLCQA